MKLFDLIQPLGTGLADFIPIDSKNIGPVTLYNTDNPHNPEVIDIAYDSRKVKPGYLFVCIRGAAQDGHKYARAAVDSGAVAIISEIALDADVPVVLVPDTRKALALLSARLFGAPAGKALQVIAVTGTKGKTTTAHMIQSILEQAGHRTGLIGTIGVSYGHAPGEAQPGWPVKTDNTTPASYEIQRFFRKMADLGCEYCVIEASSIGLKDYRVYGFPIKIGIFTNFSEDHIGGVEHKDMQEYLESKRMLFRMCEQGVVNMDDPSCDAMVEGHTCSLYRYGFSEAAQMRARDDHLLKEPGFLGVAFTVDGDLSFTAQVGIPGRFNVYNALAAISACHLLDVDQSAINRGLRRIGVKGRVESVSVPGNYTLLIDYAHNAVSMENLLKTLREYHPNRLVCLFGAGGNRAKSRRYEMGEVSGRLADLSVVTADNSRYEDVMDIIEDIKVGLHKTTGKYTVIPDRIDAIRYCIEHAQDGDIIVLAGKGHEDYQEIRGTKYHLDEREVIAEIIGRG